VSKQVKIDTVKCKTHKITKSFTRLSFDITPDKYYDLFKHPSFGIFIIDDVNCRMDYYSNIKCFYSVAEIRKEKLKKIKNDNI